MTDTIPNLMQNTVKDLQDCLNAIENYKNREPLSLSEKHALSELVELSHYLINDLDCDVEEILGSDD